VPNAREQYMQALASLTEMTRSRAERLGGLLAKQGELQSAQVGRFAEELVRRTQKNRETVSRLVQREVKRQLGSLGIATRDEISRLQQRIRALEQAVERPTARASTSSRSRTAAAGPAGRAPASRGTTTRRATASRSRQGTGASSSSSSGTGTTQGGDTRPTRQEDGENR
jgi:polyhydroxyalkanoate synthesis regulator phasin